MSKENEFRHKVEALAKEASAVGEIAAASTLYFLAGAMAAGIDDELRNVCAQFIQGQQRKMHSHLN